MTCDVTTVNAVYSALNKQIKTLANGSLCVKPTMQFVTKNLYIFIGNITKRIRIVKSQHFLH